MLRSTEQDWIDENSPPSASLAKCKVCSGLMVLILQLNAELPEKFPGHDRRIYIFACPKPSCRRRDGSIRSIRSIRVWKEVEPEATKKEEEKKPEPKKPALGDALFGGSGAFGAANPFASGAGASTNPFSTGKPSSGNPFSSNPFSAPGTSKTEQPPATETKEEEQKASASELPKTFAQTLSLNTPPSQPPPPPEPWPEIASLPKPYPTLFLSEADYETLDQTPEKAPENIRIDSADASEPSALDKEAFESTMDTTFQKFADRLAQNPEQVIRYEFGGTPLLYSKKDPVGDLLTKGRIPGCPNCGAKRTFEVQLTPNAIAELEASELSLEGMEWGTVIVGVCEGDCVPRGTEFDKVGYLEEWAGVQWEELTKRK